MKTFLKMVAVFYGVWAVVALATVASGDGHHFYQNPPLTEAQKAQFDAAYKLRRIYESPGASEYCSEYPTAFYPAMVGDMTLRVNCKVRNEWLALNP